MIKYSLTKEKIIKELNHYPILDAQPIYEKIFGQIFPRYKKSKSEKTLSFYSDEKKQNSLKSLNKEKEAFSKKMKEKFESIEIEKFNEDEKLFLNAFEEEWLNSNNLFYDNKTNLFKLKVWGIPSKYIDNILDEDSTIQNTPKDEIDIDAIKDSIKNSIKDKKNVSITKKIDIPNNKNVSNQTEPQAVIALILGILSLVTFWTIIMPIAGFFVSLNGMNKFKDSALNSNHGMSVAGFVMSIISLSFMFLFFYSIG